ncbi:hypothetical protein [Amycolatopsis anabasis]|uniref:hypothetical protein n=1 Tax=Amycolatopsis anabasis TaxID=1840409 RepID=UPI00131E698E|nr:hypothetical protein [Amycolatopsis anabasis]
MGRRVAVPLLGFLLTACATTPPAPAPAPPAPLPTPGALHGTPPREPTGLRLLLPTAPPVLFDVDAGTARPIPGVPPGDRVTAVFRAGRTPVITSAARCGPSCVEPAEVLVAEPDRPVRSLGRARSAGPAEGAAVWLIRDDGDDQCRLQRVALTGAEADAGRPASCETAVRGEGPAGLLITVQAGRPQAEDVLVEPETGRTVQQAPRIAAMAGQRLVLTELTEFSVLDLPTGARRKIARPVPNGSPGPAVASRDGRYLAVPIEDPAWQAGATRVLDLWVLELDTLRWLRTPAMPIATEFDAAALDWTESGTLVLTGELPGVALWRPGADTWTLTATAPPGERGDSVAVV